MSAAFEISHDWEEPDGLHELLQAIRQQRADANGKRIRYAYYLAEQAHSGQTRVSGEPYILHPLAVARILVDLKMDDDTIIAALLHDVLEDCPHFISSEELAKVFGEDVASLVEGVTKLRASEADRSPRSRIAETTRMAESLRKMLLAMARDYRVMVIKLADRLHNMMTLGVMAPEKQIRIASETLDVYAPLAGRLGIWQMKWQLEDLAFKYLHPHEFERIEGLVAASRSEREKLLDEAIVELKERFNQRGLKVVEVRGRPKHLYSIFNKIVKQNIEFEDIYDLLALRVIVESVPECYMALGIVHELWIPVSGLFSDYIAAPKPNGYQSLHTKVRGPGGMTFEVQIRTREMHAVAEFGVAAHFEYKEGHASEDGSRLRRLREQLFDWSTDARTSSDFLRSLSTDLFSEQVFVFTPKGAVIDLPTGSTPVDFAFRVHTDLGMKLAGAKVNGKIVPLSTPLQNGDVVEIDTRNGSTPSLDWLEFVKSAHARSKLRGHFRKLNRISDVARGRSYVEKELRAQGLDPKLYMGPGKLDAIAKHYDGCEYGEDLLAKVGAGLSSVQSVIGRLRGEVAEHEGEPEVQVSRTREGKVALVGALDGVMVHRAKCCSPIPGDDVIGYVTRGRGIMIHRSICPNALNFLNSEPERVQHYKWPPDGAAYAVELRIQAVNRQGLLSDITTVFAETKTNISGAKIRTLPNQTAEIDFTIDVPDTERLSYVMGRISNFSDVISILRLFGRSSSR